jgi:hypothetical protein
MEVSGQLHASAALPLGKEPPTTHWIGGWVGPRAIWDMVVYNETGGTYYCNIIRIWGIISSYWKLLEI